jgi:hypothetical protein
MLRFRYTVLLTDAPFTVSMRHIREAHLFDVDTREARRAAPPPLVFGRALIPSRNGGADA